MSFLKRVIARLLGIPTQPLDNPVQPTQTAGLVSQEPTTPVGNKPSVVATKRQSPVRQASPKKRKAAPQTTVAAKSTSKKQKPAQTGKSPSTRGNSTQTPVSKTPRHAKSAKKPKS